ncbi:MAG TPA: nucleotidyltransferase family protein [Anaerolineae bacterium]|nr:nucleotidyltransferase family protein [Anaerolineae bacterium]
MKALILAAGLGTRLGPLTRQTPKPMLPLGGKPLLERIIELLRRNGISEVAINLHYQPDVILRHFGSGQDWGVHLRYSYEATLLGSAGTALRQLAWVYPDPFLVYYGDVYSDANLTELIARHCTSDAVATLAVHEVNDPTRCGIVEFDQSGRVQRFVEKPRADQVFSNWANSGIYVLNPDVLRYVSDIPSDFGRDVFPRLLETGQHIQAHRLTGALIDIGAPEDYLTAQQLFSQTSGQAHSTRLDHLDRIEINPTTA